VSRGAKMTDSSPYDRLKSIISDLQDYAALIGASPNDEKKSSNFSLLESLVNNLLKARSITNYYLLDDTTTLKNIEQTLTNLESTVLSLREKTDEVTNFTNLPNIVLQSSQWKSTLVEEAKVSSIPSPLAL